MRKEPESVYDKWNISVVICDFYLINRSPWFSSFLLAATLYQRNHDMNHLLWNIESTERYILHMQALLKSSQWED
jgi:hypothetical protein